jgi:hypothetical protein
MIDPLRPYWPANRSLGGLLFRGLVLALTGAAVLWSGSRRFALLVILAGSALQAGFLLSEWMAVRRDGVLGRALLIAVGLGLIPLAVVLVLESGHVLRASVR